MTTGVVEAKNRDARSGRAIRLNGLASIDYPVVAEQSRHPRLADGRITRSWICTPSASATAWMR